MIRATVTLDVDEDAAHRAAIENWIDKWYDTFIECENSGCGCCYDHYFIEGPAIAFDELNNGDYHVVPETTYPYTYYADWYRQNMRLILRQCGPNPARVFSALRDAMAISPREAQRLIRQKNFEVLRGSGITLLPTLKRLIEAGAIVQLKKA